jgi:hypothetical protein
MRALAALLLLATCAPAPPDPMAFETEQTNVALMIEPVAGTNRTEARTVHINPPVTAICRDGWVSYSRHRRRTCAGHGGVRDWVNRPAE